MRFMSRNLSRIAVRTSAMYWGISVLWILLSDRALIALIPDPAVVNELQTYKGWFFVTVTALLLYFTLRRQLARWEKESVARREAESALRQSEERFQLAMKGTNDGLWDWNLQTNEMYLSPRWKSMLGYAENELANHYDTIIELLHPDDRERKNQLVSDFLSGLVEKFELEFRMRHKGGHDIDILSRASLVRNASGSPVRLVGTHVDITERKTAEKALHASLAEKEVLLKEIHHRVKNNLQVISSLLSLQSTRLQDDELITVFKESQYRIRAMSIIHEKLYQSGNLAAINFSDYLQTVTHELVHTFGRGGVEVEVESNPVFLEIDVAIPCGLIANELVTNSLKHAFPNRRKGKITISLKRAGTSGAEMCVRDDGIGIPKGVDFQHTKSMGILVVRSLVDQISGKLELERNGGTTIRINFPIE
jgi:PAS domain S-box-containing protein